MEVTGSKILASTGLSTIYLKTAYVFCWEYAYARLLLFVCWMQSSASEGWISKMSCWSIALPLQASLNRNWLLKSPFTPNIRKSMQQLRVTESKSEKVWMFFLSEWNQTENGISFLFQNCVWFFHQPCLLQRLVLFLLECGSSRFFFPLHYVCFVKFSILFTSCEIMRGKEGLQLRTIACKCCICRYWCLEEAFRSDLNSLRIASMFTVERKLVLIWFYMKYSL